MFPGRRHMSETANETAQPSRWAASIVSGLILLALVAAAALFYWRITASYSTAATTRGAAVPAARPAPSPVTVPSVLGSLTISPKIDFTCTLPLTAYSRRARVSLPTGTVTMDGDQSSVAASPQAIVPLPTIPMRSFKVLAPLAVLPTSSRGRRLVD